MKPVLYHRDGLSVVRYGRIFDLRAVREPPQQPGYHLWYDQSGMRLCNGFQDGFALDYRHIEARAGQTLLLARACAASRWPAVVDLMAGWGTDGLSLALRGCAVTLVEPAPMVWAMLDEFVNRLDLPASVVCATAEQWCRSHRKSVDVAYLDPMFPERRKTALPGKHAQHLRHLAWRSGTPLALQIALARGAARERVVLKRRARDPVALAPGWQLRGRRVRFDVYHAG